MPIGARAPSENVVVASEIADGIPAIRARRALLHSVPDHAGIHSSGGVRPAVTPGDLLIRVRRIPFVKCAFI